MQFKLKCGRDSPSNRGTLGWRQADQAAVMRTWSATGYRRSQSVPRPATHGQCRRSPRCLGDRWTKTARSGSELKKSFGSWTCQLSMPLKASYHCLTCLTSMIFYDIYDLLGISGYHLIGQLLKIAMAPS